MFKRSAIEQPPQDMGDAGTRGPEHSQQLHGGEAGPLIWQRAVQLVVSKAPAGRAQVD